MVMVSEGSGAYNEHSIHAVSLKWRVTQSINSETSEARERYVADKESEDLQGAIHKPACPIREMRLSMLKTSLDARKDSSGGRSGLGYNDSLHVTRKRKLTEP